MIKCIMIRTKKQRNKIIRRGMKQPHYTINEDELQNQKNRQQQTENKLKKYQENKNVKKE